ncbi:class I SAM-dependent methyltransferase [Aggregatilineales bacterium SYSU G02658]
MLKQILRTFDEKVLFPYRHTQLTKKLLPMIDNVSTILDVGTGDGHLAHLISQETGAQILGLDVCPQPHPHIDIHLYDGQKFPFPDKTFDCVLMIDMLHHTNNVSQMMKEACRVSSQFVIVKDHFWKNRFDLSVLYVADYLGNIPYGVPLPYNFLSLLQWHDLFAEQSHTVVDIDTFKFNYLEPGQHILAKLASTEIMQETNSSLSIGHSIGHTPTDQAMVADWTE